MDIWWYGTELTWDGRELVSYRTFEYVNDTDISYGPTTTYTYNADGIRTSKTVNGVEHLYYLNGSQITAETWTSGGVEYMLMYVYDETGSPIAIKYRTSSYAQNTFDVFFFEKNLQGDIVAIYNSSGTKIGSYTYDAWGNFTVTINSSVSLERLVVSTYNPFRYRGYYYDTDTSLYYLQSRYYNAQWGRFINADGIQYLGANGDLEGFNLFAYCSNNPVMGADPEGNFILSAVLIGAAVGAVFSLATELIDYSKDNENKVNWWKVGLGAVEGGLCAAFGPVTGMIVSGVASVAGDLLDGNTDIKSIVTNSVISVGFSALGTGVEHGIRTIAVNKLKKSSLKHIKGVVMSIDDTIDNNLRNVVKHPENWSKELSKKVFDGILSKWTSIALSNGLGVAFGTVKEIVT